MSITPPTAPRRATLADSAKTPDKAELIGGRIVTLMPTGHQPGRVGLRIARNLDEYTEATGRGVAYGDNTGLTVPELRSGRESFAPDAAYYQDPLPANLMKFVAAAPTFAVEIRSEGDYGPVAEREMAAKRADYFEAGTQVVWDVDPVAEYVHIYRCDAPDQPVTRHRGGMADAEPAAPGWSVAVDRIFP